MIHEKVRIEKKEAVAMGDILAGISVHRERISDDDAPEHRRGCCAQERAGL